LHDCDPPIEVKADGQDHNVAGNSCYDTISVRMLDHRTTEETDKKNGNGRDAKDESLRRWQHSH